MHGTEHCKQKRRALRHSAPRQPFSPATGLTLPDAPQTAFRLEPDARNGLSLACNDCSFQSLHSRVNVPGLLLRFPRQPVPLPVRPFGSATRTGSPRSRLRNRFKPVAESLTHAADCAACLHSPSGVLPPSGSTCSAGFAACQLAFRIRPISLRSPQPISIASNTGYGSTFRFRYVSGGLLFLKPLGTFPNMPERPVSVNSFVIGNSQYPQYLFILFRTGYAQYFVDCLCIKQGCFVLFRAGVGFTPAHLHSKRCENVRIPQRLGDDSDGRHPVQQCACWQ